MKNNNHRKIMALVLIAIALSLTLYFALKTEHQVELNWKNI